MDHAAKVQQKKNLLLAAGINEYDAHHVAKELTEKADIIESGGPNGDVVANGQGRRSQEVIPQEGMYGTQFRQNSTASYMRASDSSDSAIMQPQRPTAGLRSGTSQYISRVVVMDNEGLS
jgi:aquaporin related protein